MRPLWNFMHAIKILNGTILIVLGITMILCGKSVLEWVVGTAATIILFGIIANISLNLLPNRGTVNDIVLISITCLIALGLAIFLSYGLVNTFENIVPMVIAAYLFVLAG